LTVFTLFVSLDPLDKPADPVEDAKTL